MFNSLIFVPIHLVSWKHMMLTVLWIIVSTPSITFPVRVPILQVPRYILFSWTNFFTHTCVEWCRNHCSFNTTFERWYSNSSLFDIILELYNTLLLDNDLTLTQWPHLSIIKIVLTMFYTDCWLSNITLLIYPNFGLAMG